MKHIEYRQIKMDRPVLALFLISVLITIMMSVLAWYSYGVISYVFAFLAAFMTPISMLMVSDTLLNRV